MIAQVEERARVIERFADPVKFCDRVWPQFTLYDKQRDILYSLRDNYETIVPAGNELGKDFIAGLAIIWFFCSRRPCKIVTTSTDSGQLEDVLWGEIRRFIEQAKIKLPIQYNHLKLRQLKKDGTLVANSECVGRVVKHGEAMLGRHVERTAKNEPTTLLVVDEASGVDDKSYETADTWTHRKLVIGNPYPCSNFFFKGVKEGDKEAAAPTGEHKLRRKVIQIRAIDSPNIRLALAQQAAGKSLTYEDLIPGVARYSDYLERLANWDPIRICIGINAEFYEGAEVLLYPPDWLNRAELLQHKIPPKIKRRAKGIGVDPAEGKDSTSFAAVDEWGLIELISIKTEDTSVVTRWTLAFMRKHHLKPENKRDCQLVCFDRGGGGKQHADVLRDKGYPVRTVGFGESPTPDPKPGTKDAETRKEEKEEAYTYINKRAEMYFRLRLRMDPSIPESQFAVPAGHHDQDPYTLLRKELSPIPLMFDSEGRIKLPPKRKKTENSKEVTLIDIIGHSPDEADAVVLGVYGMEVPSSMPIVGAINL